MKVKKYLLLVLIVVLAAFLRFWQLGKVPASPDWDEVALGYNAYSLLKTGRDEYGQFLPLILRSFDDYKPALYAYLAIPFVKLFGLNVLAVRFPSAFFGVLTVLVAYFLVKELFKNSLFTIHYSLFTAFLLAISPWHLQFSRAAFESSVGMFFNILVALFFLKGLKKAWFLILAAVFAGLNIYVYQAEKAFTPLLILLLVLLWRRELFKLPRRWLFSAIGVGLILVLPFIRLSLTTPEIFLRAKGTSFASDQTPFLARTVKKLIRDQENDDFLGLVLDNRRVVYGLTFVDNYLSHFDLGWLFVSGDDARHHAPGMGLLYLVELPFLLLGIYQLVFAEVDKKTKWLVFGWFFLAPFPAAFSSGAPHAVRALRFLPIMQVLIAAGLVKFWELVRRETAFFKLKPRRKPYLYRFPIRSGMTIAVFLLFIFNFLYYLDQYFVQLNHFTSQSWQYGYEQAVEEVKKIDDRYEKIIVSNQPHLDQSYMFFLFYLQYDPATYQKEGGTVSGGFAEDRNAFGKYEFRPIEWGKEEKREGILYVGRPEDFPNEGSVIKTVNFLDGTPAIKIVEGT